MKQTNDRTNSGFLMAELSSRVSLTGSDRSSPGESRTSSKRRVSSDISSSLQSRGGRTLECFFDRVMSLAPEISPISFIFLITSLRLRSWLIKLAITRSTTSWSIYRGKYYHICFFLFCFRHARHRSIAIRLERHLHSFQRIFHIERRFLSFEFLLENKTCK